MSEERKKAKEFLERKGLHNTLHEVMRFTDSNTLNEYTLPELMEEYAQTQQPQPTKEEIDGQIELLLGKINFGHKYNHLNDLAHGDLLDSVKNIKEALKEFNQPSEQDKESEWISFKDKQPKKGQRVLIYSNNKGGIIFDYNYVDTEHVTKDFFIVTISDPDFKGNYSKDEYFTHWQPLPEPPNKLNN